MVAKLTLVGNLGMDAEVRYSADGKPVVNCRVASNFRRKDQETREWVDQTNWYRVTAFGRLAERMVEQANDGRLQKGTRVIVFGRLEASAYADRNGQPQPSLDVVADDVLLADIRGGRDGEEGGDREGAPRGGGRSYGGGGGGGGGGGSGGRGDAPAPSRGTPPADDDLEDLPF